MKHIDPKTLHGWISDGQELAVIDAREDGEFGADHLFWAVPFGMAHRETRAHTLLPRKAVRICVTDDGGRLGTELALWLESNGYTDVAVLAGGTKGWKDAGYVSFSGMNVPSKAFGEWVEHHYGTESVDPPELKQWIDSGRKMIVLDSRTQEEFTRISIPTGIPMPGAELAYRIGDLAPDPDTLVVVNCAGRTRSIMGAESLRRAGIPNKVLALRNGTMGWELAGLQCEHGRPERFVPGMPRTAALARTRANAFAEESGVRAILPGELAAFEADKTRTLYVLESATRANIAPGTGKAASAHPAGSWCRAPITGSPSVAPGSWSLTIPAFAPACPQPGSGRCRPPSSSDSSAGVPCQPAAVGRFHDHAAGGRNHQYVPGVPARLAGRVRRLPRRHRLHRPSGSRRAPGATGS